MTVYADPDLVDTHIFGTLQDFCLLAASFETKNSGTNKAYAHSLVYLRVLPAYTYT